MSATNVGALRAALVLASPDLLGFFERRVEPKQDAADLMGELMLQAWRRADALPEDDERQRMWLFTIARHVLANHRRAVRRRTALTERIRDHLAPSASHSEHTDAITVRQAVARLPKDQRELVMLIHWDDFSLAGAAELLGVNPSTARSRYAVARRSLQRDLGLEPDGASPTEIGAPRSRHF